MPTFGPGVQVIGRGCGYVLLDTNTLEIRGVPSRQCQAKRMDQGAMGWGVRAKCRVSKSREAARGNERNASKVAHASKRLHPRPLLQDDVRVL